VRDAGREGALGRGDDEGARLIPSGAPYVSDLLFHFVGRQTPGDSEAADLRQLDVFRKILTTRGLSGDASAPSFRDRVRGPVSYAWNPAATFSEAPLISPTCVCFCDIPFGSLRLHMGKYGRFGLAFSKPFLLAQGASPVFYVAVDSTGTGGMSRRKVFDENMKRYVSLVEQIDFLRGLDEDQLPQHWRDFLHESANFVDFFNWNVGSFLKPFVGSLEDSDSQNYYLEREWRVLGHVYFELSDIQKAIVPSGHEKTVADEFPELAAKLEVVT
jgi:hypothetical protein